MINGTNIISCMHRYGAGYYLVIEKGSLCDVAKVMNAIQKIIVKAKLSLDIGTEIHIAFPRTSVSQFPEVLDMLEGLFKLFLLQNYNLFIKGECSIE